MIFEIYLNFLNCYSAEKEAKREQKLLIKQLEKSKCEDEKKKMSLDRETQKEKFQRVSTRFYFVSFVLCFKMEVMFVHVNSCMLAGLLCYPAL